MSALLCLAAIIVQIPRSVTFLFPDEPDTFSVEWARGTVVLESWMQRSIAMEVEQLDRGGFVLASRDDETSMVMVGQYEDGRGIGWALFFEGDRLYSTVLFRLEP